MSLDGISIVEDSAHKLPMLDVHVLEAVLLLGRVQLVEECLLQVDSLDVEH